MSSDTSIDPSKMDNAFYQDTLDSAVERFSQVQGVRSIYRFGSVSAPGNSDIDLLFVIDPDRSVARTIHRMLEQDFSPAERYILHEHDPLIAGKDFVEELNIVRPHPGAEHLYGEAYSFSPTTESIDPWLSFYQLTDLMIQYFPLAFHHSRSRSLRWRFQIINSFRFPLHQFREVARSLDHALSSDTLDALRRTDVILAENHERRRRLPYDDSDVSFVNDAEPMLFEMTDLLFGELDSIMESQMPGMTVHGALRNRFFMRDYSGSVPVRTMDLGPLKYCIGIFPGSLGTLFTDGINESLGPDGPQTAEHAHTTDLRTTELARAIAQRNAVVRRYYSFVRTYVGGRSLYVPWWIERPTIPGMIGRLMGRGLWMAEQRTSR